MATNVTADFTDSTSSDATQSFFNTELLIRGSHALVHQVPVRKYSLAQRKGKVMIFRRYTNLPTATTALTEGTNPSGRAKSKTDVAITINQFGDFIEDSDMVMGTQPDPHTTENVSLLGQQMGETFDELYRDAWASATNTVYANGTSTVTVSQIIDRNDLDRAYRLIRTNEGKPFTPVILAGQNIGTGPVMPAYWGLLDEDVAFDIRHVDGFLQTNEYAKQTGVIAGEIGADKNGIRFLASPEGFVLAGVTAVTIAATDVQNTASFADIYSIFVCGRDAMGGLSLGSKNGGVIRKALGSGGTSDPLNMRATVGWKKYDQRVILNNSFLVEIQCAASL